MLIHHSEKDYDVAASEAAKEARAKMEALIEQGRRTGPRLIEEVQAQVVEDYIVRGTALDFQPTEDAMKVAFADHRMGIGKFALGQMLEAVHMPRAFYDRLMNAGDWGREHAADTLNKLFHNQMPEQRRIRAADDRVRGFLSPAYMPRDVPMLVDAFFKACGKVGAMPFEGRLTETKFNFRVILPMVFEPVKHEVCSFFLNFSESEFGDGATVLSGGILRLACTNRATFENAMRKVHLGSSSKAEGITWSRDTIRKMTAATAAQLGDAVEQQLSPAAVNRTLDVIRRADAEKVDPWKVGEFLKKHCTKDEARQIVDVFNSPDVVNMPAGQTRYRMSNAISFFANGVDDGDRVLELQRLAGAALAGGRVDDN